MNIYTALVLVAYCYKTPKLTIIRRELITIYNKERINYNTKSYQQQLAEGGEGVGVGLVSIRL